MGIISRFEMLIKKSCQRGAGAAFLQKIKNHITNVI
jgi:hypothetical protein